MADPIDIARRSYEAYAKSDRSAIEALIADDFHFTSPLDNRIDRATYFERCWPNNEVIVGFEFIHLVGHGDRVFVTYEGRNVWRLSDPRDVRVLGHRIRSSRPPAKCCLVG